MPVVAPPAAFRQPRTSRILWTDNFGYYTPQIRETCKDVDGQRASQCPAPGYLIEWPYMQIAPDNSLQVCIGELCEYNADYVDMSLVV